MLFILATLSVSSGILVAQSSRSNAEEAILALESRWNQAHLKGDVEVLDSLWAPEITVVVPEMPPFKKADLLKLWRSMKVSFTRYETTEMHVQVFGNTAVVTGRLERSRDFGGQVRSEDWLYTKTYALIDGQWKVVAYHASPTPK
jgi:ketosteroid isomerase-like protein